MLWVTPTLFLDKDAKREDLGKYPIYLYDNNPFNDVKYVFNKGIIFRVFPMIMNYVKGNNSGITSFDTYNNWMKSYQFGVNSKNFFPDGVIVSTDIPEQKNLTDKERRIVEDRVEQNIVSTARDNPGVDFYYFFTPYSALFWKQQLDAGTFEKRIQAERIVIENILRVDNIKLFSINNRYDLIIDLNNYKDAIHYGGKSSIVGTYRDL